MVMIGGVSHAGGRRAGDDRVHDAGDRDVDEGAVIDADEHEPFGIQQSAQPVPSTGLVDEERR